MSLNLFDVSPSLPKETYPAGSATQCTPQSSREALIRGDFKVWLLLLVIISLAGLGSLSFATVLSGTSSTLSSTSPSPAYTAGICTAEPTDIQYLTGASSAPGTSNSTLSTWLQTGKTQQDLDNVQACAASFTLKYEAYTASDLKSLEASVPMLSAAAKQRFYTPNSQAQINRMDPMWRASIQSQQLVRSVQLKPPSVIDVQRANGRILVWVTVPYILTIQTNGDMYPSNAVLTVLLVNAPGRSTTGTGWQVSDWNDNPGAFRPHYPL